MRADAAHMNRHGPYRALMCSPRPRERGSVPEFIPTRAGANRDTTRSRQQRHGGGNEALGLTDPLRQRLVVPLKPHVY